jgi:phage host-nuclease inhibitor protein Gam
MKPPATTDDCSALLREACEIELHLQSIDTETNLVVTQAKEALEKRSRPLETRKRAIEATLRAWFRGMRSRLEGNVAAFLFGRIIARPKSAVVYLEGWSKESAIEALLRKPTMAGFVRVSYDINKEAMHAASDEMKERLAECGVSFDAGEKVSVELDLEKFRAEGVRE